VEGPSLDLSLTPITEISLICYDETNLN